MTLIQAHKLINEAYRQGYGLAVHQPKWLTGLVAEELQAPIILQIAEVRLNQSPLHIIGPAMVQAAKEVKVPVAVH